jgi:molecular chaperone DnaK
LSKEEVERMKQEAELNAESDKKAKEDADTLNAADSLIFQVGKTMDDLEGKITESEKTEITNTVDKLKDAYSKKEISEVKTLTEEVNKKFQEISQKLYQTTTESTNNDEVKDEDFQNVDFEEVK